MEEQEGGNQPQSELRRQHEQQGPEQRDTREDGKQNLERIPVRRRSEDAHQCRRGTEQPDRDEFGSKRNREPGGDGPGKYQEQASGVKQSGRFTHGEGDEPEEGRAAAAPKPGQCHFASRGPRNGRNHIDGSGGVSIHDESRSCTTSDS